MRPQLLNSRPYFADVPDPRRETRNQLHDLQDILMIALCAVLSGVEDWVGMADFAEEKEAWLRRFLALPNGIPAHDTLRDVLGRIDPVAFRTAFTAWATAALPGLADEQVCVDGQAVRGSRDGANPAVPRVSAFAGRARWVLAQPAVAEQSNEITAIPDLLALLDLPGATVSIDAMGCQKAIAQAIMAAGGDYVLTLKDHHPTCAKPSDCGSEAACGRLPFWKRWRRTTAGSQSIATPSVIGSTSWRRNRTGPDSKRSGGSSPLASSATKPARNAVICYFLCSRSATGLPLPSAAIGGSKINRTGSWTCNSARMPAGLGRTIPPQTWP